MTNIIGGSPTVAPHDCYESVLTGLEPENIVSNIICFVY